MSTLEPPKAGRREWVGLAVLALACVVYAMDLTVLHLAIPQLSEDLQPTSAQLLWIADIYGFMVAGLLITMGTLGDRIGRRRLLLMGAAGFALASLLAAFSTSAEMLIASRALLGIAGATIAPSTLSLIRNLFENPGQRTFAIGVWITAYSLGGALGPLLGGVLLEFFWWGSVFLLAIPVMVLLLILGPLLLPEYRDPNAGRIDLTSAALSLVAVLAVVYGLKQMAQDGLGSMPLAAIALGLILGAVFVWRQRRLADPLIDLNLFRIPAFSASLAVYTLGILVLFGSFLFIYQYLQLVLGLSPLEAGVVTLPSFIAFVVGSMLAPAFVKRMRPAWVMAGGLGTSAVGLLGLTQVTADSGLDVLIVTSFVYSLGIAPVFTLTNDLIIGAAPPERAGAASAISETGAELGGALSIAILGTLGTAVYRTQVQDDIPETVPEEEAEAARDTLGGAVAASGDLADSLANQVLDVAQAAFTQGLQVVALVSAVMAGLAAVGVALFLRQVRAAPHEPAPESG
jgi:DHA2 family multidrug resistance protein-like MFS transporter